MAPDDTLAPEATEGEDADVDEASAAAVAESEADDGADSAVSDDDTEETK